MSASALSLVFSPPANAPIPTASIVKPLFALRAPRSNSVPSAAASSRNSLPPVSAPPRTAPTAPAPSLLLLIPARAPPDHVSHHASRIMHHASRITHHASRFTEH